jgi:hypothetical protein
METTALLAILLLLCVLGICLLVFVVTHLHPLTAAQVTQLAAKRRGKHIKVYFKFDKTHYTVNLEFKKRMNPRGEFYPLNESLSKFPAVAAGMLKYKKHEWIIIAFEKQRQVDCIWVNKGLDRTQVTAYLPSDLVRRLAVDNVYTSVLVLHNHPNPNPNEYAMHQPSNKDLQSAKAVASILAGYGVNLIEFVCERGGHHEYARFISDTFYPASTFATEILKINGSRKSVNLSLHFERVFE